MVRREIPARHWVGDRVVREMRARWMSAQPRPRAQRRVVNGERGAGLNCPGSAHQCSVPAPVRPTRASATPTTFRASSTASSSSPATGTAEGFRSRWLWRDAVRWPGGGSSQRRGSRDTAHGGTLSEEFLGRALRFASRRCVDRDQVRRPDRRPTARRRVRLPIQRACDDTVEAPRHGPHRSVPAALPDTATAPDETLGALDALVRAGKVQRDRLQQLLGRNARRGRVELNVAQNLLAAGEEEVRLNTLAREMRDFGGERIRHDRRVTRCRGRGQIRPANTTWTEPQPTAVKRVGERHSGEQPAG